MPVCRGKEAYVHWWYSPNSYNEWIPQDQAAEKLETDQPARGEPALQAVGCLPFT